MLSLNGQNISLRAVEPKDAQIIKIWENNQDNWQLSNTLAPFSEHIIEQYIEIAQKDIFETRQLRLMIETTKENRAVGAVDLFDFDPLHQRAGVGILINATADRREGYALEALTILRAYCKEVLMLKQLFCNISERNVKSQKLFEKADFVKTGTQKQWLRVSHHEWEDVFFYQLLL